MDTGLAGDVVVVLGAAGGIGAAIAQAFAAEGCRLALIERALLPANDLGDGFPAAL